MWRRVASGSPQRLPRAAAEAAASSEAARGATFETGLLIDFSGGFVRGVPGDWHPYRARQTF
jgi:hypothetical protein